MQKSSRTTARRRHEQRQTLQNRISQYDSAAVRMVQRLAHGLDEALREPRCRRAESVVRKQQSGW
jgi:hypothetical protein